METWDGLLASVVVVSVTALLPSGATPGRASAVPLPNSDAPPAWASSKPPWEDDVSPMAQDDGPKTRPAVPRAPRVKDSYRFISYPDFLNQDVADLTAGDRETYTDPDTGEVANSTNAAYETALERVLSEVGSHGASDLWSPVT